MDKIKEAIKCAICKNVMNLPVILPCGHSICKHHADEITEVDGLISCKKCWRDHPKQAFPPNEDLANIIEAQIANMDLGPKHKIAKDACDKLDTVIGEIEQILKDPYYFSHEEINELQRQVQLKREELKNQIDNEFDKFDNKLEEYKANCKSHLSTTEYKIEASKISYEVRNSRGKLKEWVSVLNEVKMTNEPIWIRIKNESDNSIDTLETKIEKFKQNELLLRKFDESQIQVAWLKNINIDLAAFNYLNLESEIIVGDDQIIKLFTLCKFEPNDILSLIYRGSRDGFGASDFHQKCDSRPNTLTILKANTGSIFGGFTQNEWNQIGPNGHYKADDKVFLFSLVNKEDKPCRLDVAEGKKDEAIACNTNFGPVFGKYCNFSNSICIANNSNLPNVENCAPIGSSFLMPDYECKCTNSENYITYNGCQRCKFLAGDYKFQITEIEVFQKQ